MATRDAEKRESRMNRNSTPTAQSKKQRLCLRNGARREALRGRRFRDVATPSRVRRRSARVFDARRKPPVDMQEAPISSAQLAHRIFHVVACRDEWRRTRAARGGRRKASAEACGQAKFFGARREGDAAPSCGIAQASTNRFVEEGGRERKTIAPGPFSETAPRPIRDRACA